MHQVRFLLNSSHSGANAWFALADELGFFAAEGLEISFTAGSGAYSAAKRLMDEPFDFAFGDVNALIALNAEHTAAPTAVFCVHHSSPSVIGVPSAGGIHHAADLVGKVLLSHPADVALKTFSCYAAAAGIDASQVGIRFSAAPMLDLLLEALSGRADGVFGYYSTQTTVLRGRDPALPAKVRFLAYPQTVPDLYGSAIMASRAMLTQHPDALRATLRAVNRGLAATFADPSAAVAAVVGRNPAANHEFELIRLSDTLSRDIRHPEVRTFGVGEMDPERLGRSIELLATSAPLARRPASGEVFTPDFLPDRSARRYGVAEGQGG